MLIPRGHRLLVKPEELEQDIAKNQNEEYVSEGGIVIPKATEAARDADRELDAQTCGTVIAIGPTCWLAYDRDHEEWEPWAKVGDKVLYKKYVGEKVVDPETDEEFIILNDNQISCTVA